MGKDEVVSYSEKPVLVRDGKKTLMESTYIQGSVEESPSGEQSRSLDRPGAKMPRPYPCTATHHGSFIVIL